MTDHELLAGTTALVVGGGRGIGAATCEALARHGAAVAILDVEPARATEVRDAVRAAGGVAVDVVADIRDEDQVVDAVASARDRLGGIDALVNVAGGMQAHSPWRRLDSVTADQWDSIVAINLRYVFLTSRAVLGPMMEKGRGAIVNIASISGMFGAPMHAAYGAAKAALMSLTRSLALEYGRHGIRVNSVAPGSILTPAVAGGRLDEAGSARMAKMIPLGRRGEPGDVANAVVYLVSDLAGYVTGHTLVVDGGASSRFPLPLPGAHPSETP